jgi:hypothetical protein
MQRVDTSRPGPVWRVQASAPSVYGLQRKGWGGGFPEFQTLYEPNLRQLLSEIQRTRVAYDSTHQNGRIQFNSVQLNLPAARGWRHATPYALETNGNPADHSGQKAPPGWPQIRLLGRCLVQGLGFRV